ncbi:MAG TPA: hemolysin III family protein [Cyclobacteriaceae bacterium]
MEKLGTREQTFGEELANSISHGIGFLGALIITPILIMAAIPSGAAGIAGASVFGVSMMILYLASTLYHAFPRSRTKRLFQILDHAAIFLLIAGTYTPFTLSVLPGAWGWTLFGAVWGLAIFGIVLKSIGGAGTSRLSVALYLGMGWLAVFAAEPLFKSLPAQGLFWIVMGGLLYSAGVFFFVYDHKIRFNHFIWHLFVLGGTACHVVAVLFYAYQLPF